MLGENHLNRENNQRKHKTKQQLKRKRNNISYRCKSQDK